MRTNLLLLSLFIFSYTLAQKERKVSTSYGYKTTQLTTITKDTPQAIQTDKFYLNSTSNALVKGGKNRIILPVYLPENTQEWFYRYTASRNENDINNTLKTFNLAGELTEYINSKNPLKGAVNNLTTPPGADICDIYVMTESNAKLFKEKEDFEYVISASRENYKSGTVMVKNNNQELIYLGINNPDSLHGIHVAVEIVAIVAQESQIEETIRIPIYTYYLE
ncbi:hypothetical protein [Pseudofulvibacter geojedonensis]|uniref:Uncharacterized protein n=1 Tax=Pseudofulvibacter geojedonensis TaxID=1123758 RepID=A0ABW3I4S4_9FLAO